MLIDVKMISQYVDFLNNGGVKKKKKEKKKVESDKDSDGSSDEETDSDVSSDEETDSENWKYEQDRYQGSDEEEEDSGFEDDSDSDEAELKKAEAAAAAEAEAKEELDKLKQPRVRKECIRDLIRLSEEKGLIVKKGDEEEILEMMIPYIRGRGWHHHRINNFLHRVKEHMYRCSSLDNVDTVKTAIETNEFSWEEDRWKINEQIASNTSTTREEEDDMVDAKEDQVNQTLNKTVVPTKEEGVATPMNQIKQEENGDMMEMEEQETLSPLNLPKPGKENTASAYSSIIESLDRVGTNKRKLAQIQPGY